ncbi:MAG: NAD-dependent epimerase/dehydratase family protein [Elusimicrobia bacterium]|nr:NAD-dependent epimerase/dehydratase family protein [Elusimicrobiota bacterium]
MLRRLRAKTVGLLSAPGEKENQLLDRAWVADRLAVVKPDVLFLAGGPSGGILENQRKPGDLLTVNLAMELNVLQLARRSRARRVVYFGSSCICPREAAQPMKESALWGGPLEPTSRAYAVAKLTGLEMGLAFDRQDGTRRF